jgi:hypothetical protein
MPTLAAERTCKRKELLAAAEVLLARIVEPIERGTLTATSNSTETATTSDTEVYAESPLLYRGQIA